MMHFLLDTNIVSELRKENRCDPAVELWQRSELTAMGGALSVVTIGEIRKGIELIGKRDSVQAARLDIWLQRLYHQFADRVLPITANIAEEWGRLNAKRPLPAIDSLLAATAIVHGLVLATRNLNDLQGIGCQLVNPFEFGSE